MKKVEIEQLEVTIGDVSNRIDLLSPTTDDLVFVDRTVLRSLVDNLKIVTFHNTKSDLLNQIRATDNQDELFTVLKEYTLFHQSVNLMETSFEEQDAGDPTDDAALEEPTQEA